jgi:hypothetical protein
MGTLGYSAAPKFSANGSLLSTAPLTGTNGALPAFQPACGVATGPEYGTGYTTVSSDPSSCGVTTATSYTVTPLSVGYVDPYLGGRAPEYINYTLGFQHQWTSALVSTITYVGSQGHFLPADGSNARGYWADQLDPKYLYLGSRLADTGTAETADCATYSLPCPANFNTGQPLSTALKPFPFQSVGDSFGYVANSNYNALQVSLNMRASHGMTFMMNYTWSKAIDDGGTYRTGYTIPAAYSPTGKTIQQDRIERSLSTTDQPHHIVLTGVWDLPLGRTVLNGNAVERAILGGFKVSEIFQGFTGSPLVLTGSSCQTNQAQSTCEPTLNPNFAGSARVNGKWGAGAVASTTTPISYIAASGGTEAAPTGPFIAPSLLTTNTTFPNGNPFAPSYTFGNAARTAPLDLFGPGNYELDLAVIRSFPLHFSERAHLVLRGEMTNVTNKTFFAIANSAVGNANFGTVTTSPNYNRRAAQLIGRIEF